MLRTTASVLLLVALLLPSGVLAGSSAARTARSLVEQGLDEQALPHFREAVDANPTDLEVHLEYQDLMNKLGYREDLVREYRGRRDASPTADNHYLYGRATGKPGPAREAFDKALALDPKHVYAMQGLGGVAAAEGRLDDARAKLREALALAEGRPVLQARLHNKMANILLAQDKLNEALDSWKAAAALDPADYHAPMNMGAALSIAGRLEEAEGQLALAVQKAPGNPVTHVNRAYVLFKLRRFDEALAHFEAALAINPRDRTVQGSRDLVARVHRGEIPFAAFEPYEKALAAQLSDPKLAVQHYREVLLLAPNFATAHMNLGLALVALGEGKEAEDALVKAVELAPDDPAARFNLGYLLLGMERPDDALLHLNRAHTLDPQDTDTLSTIALSHLAAGRVGEAEGWYLKALELSPRDPVLWFQFGGAQAAAGDLEAAEKKLRKALELAPRFLAPRVQLVAILTQERRWDDALKELAFIEEAAPGHPDVRAQRAKIEASRDAERQAASDPGRVRVRQIFVRDREVAEKVVLALRSGQSFELLARTHGQGPEAARSGDVGYVTLEEIRPEVAEALRGLKRGGTSGLVDIGAGFLILRRES